MIESDSDVAKIWCRGARTEFGSGLLVARNLVLTAKHVVGGGRGPAPCSVRLMRHDSLKQDRLPVRVAWTSEKADLALLKIEEGEHQPHYSYRFCSLRHTRPISSVSVTGFPLATRDEFDKAIDYAVEGSLKREGRRSVSFSVLPPDEPNRQTLWQGMSGAAAFVSREGRIRDVFGVIEEARKEFLNGKLFIASVESLLKDADFSKAYRETSGESPRFVELTDSRRQLTAERFGFVEDLYRDLEDLPGGSKSPHVFEIDVARVSDFDKIKAIISGKDHDYQRLSPRLLLPSAEEDYKRLSLYLQAPGGYGKTSFLRKLIRSAIDEGYVVFHLDTKGRDSDWSDIESLFRTSTRLGGNYDLFEQAANDPKQLVLVVLDGLNETGEEWRTIRSRLEELTSNYGRVSVIAADRMNPDRAKPEGYGLATLLPIQVAGIPDDRLRDLVNRSTVNRLLSVPFFLDKYYAMREATDRPNLIEFGRADIISAYLREYAVPDTGAAADDLIKRLSGLAIESYGNGSLLIDEKPFKSWLPKSDRDRLCDVGIIVRHGKQGYIFSHQLIHDFLAAKWLADGGAAAWTRTNFDTVTLGARSFDALELASELLGERADEFVIEVYDWNYKAALECILNLDAGLSGKASPLPPELKDAVFTLRAEKVFDRFQSTRDSARGKLGSFQAASAIDFAGMRSQEELIDAIRSGYRPGNETGLYQDWKVLFTLQDLTVAHWSSIQDSPLLGWTAANVFRRLAMKDDKLKAHLVSLYRALRRSQPKSDRGVTTRWRIVHALGGASGDDAAGLLSSAVLDEDEDEWVRYGAARSLVEIASRMPDREKGRTVLDPLIRAQVKLPEKVRREVRDVAMLAEAAPSWWPDLYGEVLRAGMLNLDPDDAEEERERALW